MQTNLSTKEIEQMVEQAEAMIRMYPFVSMKYCARTYDEKDVCIGDIVKLTILLERVEDPWKFDMKVFKPVCEIEPPERKNWKEKKY